MSGRIIKKGIHKGFQEYIKEALRKNEDMLLDFNLNKRTEVRYIFIYGSLKNGHSNNARMRKLKADFVGVARAEFLEIYYYETPTAFHKNGICCAIRTDNENQEVYGELWRVINWKSLDKYEGSPFFYKREKIKVWVNVKGKEELIEVEAYLFQEENELKRNGEPIFGGCYIEDEWMGPKE